MYPNTEESWDYKNLINRKYTYNTETKLMFLSNDASVLDLLLIVEVKPLSGIKAIYV